MSAAVAWAIGASALTSIGGTLYTQDMQKQAQDKARNAQEDAEEEARANEKKIRDASAEVKVASTADFGLEDDGIGSYDDFLSPVTPTKPSAGLGNSGGTGVVKAGSTGASGLGL